jgi:hypothetical protein
VDELLLLLLLLSNFDFSLSAIQPRTPITRPSGAAAATPRGMLEMS